MRSLLILLCCAVVATTLHAQGKTTIAAVFPPPAAASIVGGVTDHAVLAFTVQRVQGAPPTTMLTGVMPSMTGTATLADLVRWRLYADANANGVYNAGVDTQIGTQSTTLAPSFTGFSMAVPSGTPLAMFITLDVAAAASNGATFMLQLTNLQFTTSGGGRAGGPITSNAATIDNSAIPPVTEIERNATAIPSASNDALGNVLLAGQSFTYDVLNTGTSNLVLTGSPAVQISGQNNCTVNVTPPGTVVIAPNASTTFALLVTPLSVAAFSFNVSIVNNEPASSQNPYTFSASGTGLTPAATQLTITQQPAGSTGGLALATQPIVEARNGGGTLDASFTGLVTAAITTGTGTTGAALLGTFTISAVAGVATFNGLAINLAGTGYSLTFTSTSLTPAVSTTFNITIGAAAQLTMTVQPGNGTGGLALSTQPQVAVQDAGGNTLASDNSTLVNVAIRTGTGTTGATLLGTTAQIVVAGVAVYTNLAINLEGAGYELEFTSTGLSNEVSNALTIAIGPAAQLAITTQPGNGTGGLALSTQPVVTVRDAGGNTLTGDTGRTITASIASGPGSIVAGATANTASGIATFSGLAIDLIGAYTLDFDATALTGATSAGFNVTLGAAAQLSITTQPGNGTGGLALSTQPVVAVQDAGGNTLTGDTGRTITAGIASGPGSIVAGATANTASGIATFSGLAIDVVGAYTLDFDATGLAGDTSAGFNVTLGAAAQLSITTQPGNGTGGLALSTQPVVAVQDAGGNTLTGDTGRTITASIASGPGSIVAGATANTAGGVATFSGLAIDLVGAYTLNLDATGLTGDTSASFNVTLGAAARLSITTQPGNGTAGLALSTQPVVTVQDAGGNALTGDTGRTITASIASGPGSILAGATANTASGDATFSGLAIDLVGAYTLDFDATGLAGDTSASFNITVGAAAAQLSIQTQPGNGTGGLALSAQPVVELQDSLGNTLTADNTSQVTAAITATTGTTGAALLGTTTVTVTAGVATFAGLAIDLAGTGYELTFSSTGVPDEASVSFDIVVGATASLRIAVQPSGAAPGVAFTAQPVIEVVDAGGNVVTSDSTTQVQASILSSPAGMILGGTATVTASSGVCTFSGLSINLAGGPVTLRFADTGAAFAPVDANTFNVVGSGSGGGKKKKSDEGCSTGERGDYALMALIGALIGVMALRRRKAA